jgi:putative oxidoreductase
MQQKVQTGARYLLGLIYFIFGLNGFLNFIPLPPLPDAAGAYLGALNSTGYFFPLLKGTEVLAALLLLSGFAAPLALILLAPITIHIFLFHFVLTPGADKIALPILMIALHVTAAAAYKNLYQPLFRKV